MQRRKRHKSAALQDVAANEHDATRIPRGRGVRHSRAAFLTRNERTEPGAGRESRWLVFLGRVTQFDSSTVTENSMRKLISSGSPYEPKVGISRAVRVGAIITVAGTAPLGPDGKTVGRGDAAAQARRCLEIISAALEKAGASMANVVRTRILLTRIDDWEAVAMVHGEFFRDIRPVNTIMQISRFIDPDWLVEIEADAVVDVDGDKPKQA